MLLASLFAFLVPLVRGMLGKDSLTCTRHSPLWSIYEFYTASLARDAASLDVIERPDKQDIGVFKYIAGLVDDLAAGVDK